MLFIVYDTFILLFSQGVKVHDSLLSTLPSKQPWKLEQAERQQLTHEDPQEFHFKVGIYAQVFQVIVWHTNY